MKKKISLVQVNFQQGPKNYNSYYLPYSLGTLWSYATVSDFIRNEYHLDQIVFFREPDIDDLALRLSDNSVVAFSTYVWNKNYHYQLAKKIKQFNQKCTIIFGGPELPIKDPNIFKNLPFIDIVVKKEGEKIFKEVLENFSSLHEVKGILLNRQELVDTGNGDRIDNLNDLISPYTSDFFSTLIKKHTDIEWAATLETNRGCPYQCTFCDWGSLTYSKVKCFDLDRVFSDIEWMGQNRIGFVFVADANFGMFPERDDQIIDKIISTQHKYGFPKTFTLTWAKNQKSEIIKIAKKLIDANILNNGLTISVQTLNEEVLDIIKRKNLNQHKIEEIFLLCENHNIPLNTELILGLPKETLSSWKKSVFDLFNYGNHTGVDITQVELLENAEMNLVQKEIYSLKSIEVFDYLGSDETGIEESIQVVVSTDTMSIQDMIEAQWFNTFINTFHIGGLTVFVSRFLKKYKNIEYSSFYEDLENYLNNWTWFLEIKNDLKNDFSNWMTNGKLDTGMHGVSFFGYNLIYKLLIYFHAENKFEEFYFILSDFLDRYDLADIKDQLLLFQKNYVVRFDEIENYPYNIKFDFDFYGYLIKNQTLYQSVELNFNYNDKKNITKNEFLELLYYGRRRNFGRCEIC